MDAICSKQQTDFMKELLGGLNNEITRQAQLIAKLEQELAAEKKAAGHWMEQSCKDHNRAEKLEQQLSRYQGGVEVEGDFWVNGLFNCTIHIRDDFGKLDNVPAGCRVRVHVMEVE